MYNICTKEGGYIMFEPKEYFKLYVGSLAAKKSFETSSFASRFSSSIESLPEIINAMGYEFDPELLVKRIGKDKICFNSADGKRALVLTTAPENDGFILREYSISQSGLIDKNISYTALLKDDAYRVEINPETKEVVTLNDSLNTLIKYYNSKTSDAIIKTCSDGKNFKLEKVFGMIPAYFSPDDFKEYDSDLTPSEQIMAAYNYGKKINNQKDNDYNSKL
jgi:hypothetical protein